MPLILMPNDLCLLVFECFPGLSSNPSAMPLYLMKCDMYIWSILGGCRLLLKLIMHTRVTPHWGEQPGHTVLSNVPPPQFMSLMTPILSETMQIFYPTYFSLSYTLCNHSQDGEQDERFWQSGLAIIHTTMSSSVKLCILLMKSKIQIGPMLYAVKFCILWLVRTRQGGPIPYAVKCCYLFMLSKMQVGH